MEKDYFNYQQRGMNMKHFIKKSILLIFLGLHFQAQSHSLVAINSINSNIKIECWYATHNNFTGQRIYPKAFFKKAYLLKEVAEQLSKAQKELEQEGLGLLIWDAFRPLEGQKKLWNCCPDSRFVFPPEKGGKHTRGTTVDLTIINLETEEPLDMGTGFDVFIDRSASECTTLSDLAKQNRKLLKTIMENHGFTQLPSEWWHFDYKNLFDYPVLDIIFDELK